MLVPVGAQETCAHCGAKFTKRHRLHNYCRKECRFEAIKIRNARKERRIQNIRECSTTYEKYVEFYELVDKAVDKFGSLNNLSKRCGITDTCLGTWVKRVYKPSEGNRLKFLFWADENGITN